MLVFCGFYNSNLSRSAKHLKNLNHSCENRKLRHAANIFIFIESNIFCLADDRKYITAKFLITICWIKTVC